MSTISDILTSETNYSNQLKAKTDTVTGTASEQLNISDFLQLLTKQLKAQDPTSSQGSNATQGFVGQICQFSQLEVSTETYDAISQYNGEQKAESLLGKSVVLKDPDNKDKTISGTVFAVYHKGKNSAINVNGTMYSPDSVLYTYDPKMVSTKTTTDTSSGSGSDSSTNPSSNTQ